MKVLYILLIIIFSSSSNVWSANEALQINERIKILEQKIQNTKELEGEIESLKNRLEKFENKSSNTETQDLNGQFPSYNRARQPQNFPGAPVTDLGPQDIQNQFISRKTGRRASFKRL